MRRRVGLVAGLGIAVALWTALHASDATWALYNGAIAYVLIGAMLGGEWLLRPRHAS